MNKIISTLISLCIPFTCFAYTKVGIIGDSISFPHHTSVAPWSSFHSCLARDFDKELREPVRIINYSIGGTSTDTLMIRLNHMIENDRPDIVIITLGINDCLQVRPYTEIIRCYEQAIELLNKENIPLMIGTIDAFAVRNKIGTAEQHFIHFKKNIYDKLKEKYHHVTFFPFLSKELTTNPIYKSFDIIHVNEKGHRVIANQIKPFLASFILSKINLVENTHP